VLTILNYRHIPDTDVYSDSTDIGRRSKPLTELNNSHTSTQHITFQMQDFSSGHEIGFWKGYFAKVLSHLKIGQGAEAVTL
jgi:hypothetical protein